MEALVRPYVTAPATAPAPVVAQAPAPVPVAARAAAEGPLPAIQQPQASPDRVVAMLAPPLPPAMPLPVVNPAPLPNVVRPGGQPSAGPTH